jgi:peptidoglycan/LPS O-acetylase OafA/YrhL
MASVVGMGWLRSWGRLSYEIYLRHMFVVFTVIQLCRFVDADLRWGFAWHLLALPLCWMLGAAAERWLSTPCQHWLRASLLPRRVTQAARVEPLAMAD